MIQIRLTKKVPDHITKIIGITGFKPPTKSNVETHHYCVSTRIEWESSGYRSWYQDAKTVAARCSECDRSSHYKHRMKTVKMGDYVGWQMRTAGIGTNHVRCFACDFR